MSIPPPLASHLLSGFFLFFESFCRPASEFGPTRLVPPEMCWLTWGVDLAGAGWPVDSWACPDPTRTEKSKYWKTCRNRSVFQMRARVHNNNKYRYIKITLTFKPMRTYIMCGYLYGSWSMKQLRVGWLRVKNGWLKVWSSSVIAGYELRMAGWKFKQLRADWLRAENGWQVWNSSELAGYSWEWLAGSMKQLRAGWPRAENGLLEVWSNSELAGYLRAENGWLEGLKQLRDGWLRAENGKLIEKFFRDDVQC